MTDRFTVDELFDRWVSELTRVDQEPNLALIASIEALAAKDGWSIQDYASHVAMTAGCAPKVKRGRKVKVISAGGELEGEVLAHICNPVDEEDPLIIIACGCGMGDDDYGRKMAVPQSYFEEDDEDGYEYDERYEEHDYSTTNRQQAQEEALEKIEEVYGKFDKTAGPDGAHYVAASPFKADGLVCANCVFYEGPRGCEIVEGDIDPDAVCKFWIIPNELIEGEEHEDSYEYDMLDDDAVYVLGSLTAAGKFDPDLHPRAKDGKFINVLGFVNLLFNGKRYRGQVKSITPDRARKGDPDITVEVQSGISGDAVDTFTVVRKARDLSSAPKYKGILDMSPVEEDEKRARSTSIRVSLGEEVSSEDAAAALAWFREAYSYDPEHVAKIEAKLLPLIEAPDEDKTLPETGSTSTLVSDLLDKYDTSKWSDSTTIIAVEEEVARYNNSAADRGESLITPAQEANALQSMISPQAWDDHVKLLVEDGTVEWAPDDAQDAGYVRDTTEGLDVRNSVAAVYKSVREGTNTWPTTQYNSLSAGVKKYQEKEARASLGDTAWEKLTTDEQRELIARGAATGYSAKRNLREMRADRGSAVAADTSADLMDDLESRISELEDALDTGADQEDIDIIREDIASLEKDILAERPDAVLPAVPGANPAKKPAAKKTPAPTPGPTSTLNRVREDGYVDTIDAQTGAVLKTTIGTSTSQQLAALGMQKLMRSGTISKPGDAEIADVTWDSSVGTPGVEYIDAAGNSQKYVFSADEAAEVADYVQTELEKQRKHAGKFENKFGQFRKQRAVAAERSSLTREDADQIVADFLKTPAAQEFLKKIRREDNPQIVGADSVVTKEQMRSNLRKAPKSEYTVAWPFGTPATGRGETITVPADVYWAMAVQAGVLEPRAEPLTTGTVAKKPAAKVTSDAPGSTPDAETAKLVKDYFDSIDTSRGTTEDEIADSIASELYEEFDAAGVDPRTVVDPETGAPQTEVYQLTDRVDEIFGSELSDSDIEDYDVMYESTDLARESLTDKVIEAFAKLSSADSPIAQPDSGKTEADYLDEAYGDVTGAPATKPKRLTKAQRAANPVPVVTGRTVGFDAKTFKWGDVAPDRKYVDEPNEFGGRSFVQTSARPVVDYRGESYVFTDDGEWHKLVGTRDEYFSDEYIHPSDVKDESAAWGDPARGVPLADILTEALKKAGGAPTAKPAKKAAKKAPAKKPAAKKAAGPGAPEAPGVDALSEFASNKEARLIARGMGGTNSSGYLPRKNTTSHRAALKFVADIMNKVGVTTSPTSGKLSPGDAKKLVAALKSDTRKRNDAWVAVVLEDLVGKNKSALDDYVKFVVDDGRVNISYDGFNGMHNIFRLDLVKSVTEKKPATKKPAAKLSKPQQLQRQIDTLSSERRAILKEIKEFNRQAKMASDRDEPNMAKNYRTLEQDKLRQEIALRKKIKELEAALSEF